MTSTDLSTRLAKAKFRAWHRGTREADYTFGCFFDTYHADWSEEELAWFEKLLTFEDPDVLAWTMGTQEVPAEMQGAQMDALLKLDYVRI
ncbi:FAD assembly factor SdhE [Aurantiacibacter sp. D1-12]|uniref:FAD assembly factor SdhE n=1 Tax=Aurantiacibacter sp. D1-12 TaxID=2993658 RepID=UPI00237CF484|nr:succinate dehydrogenase assembly factor 2 [Aurantiacibacter sp. D1-12]MDE1466550.1 succinate dehydrogenase assembly factor 2 [Aurantiacibacter sp. D1-12]